MPALELLTGYTTAPGASFVAFTMAVGNSATVRNSPQDKKIFLLNCWTDHQVAGVIRIRSPYLAEATQGLRLRATISEVKPLLPLGYRQQLRAQDTLTLEQSGSGVAGDIENTSLLVYYEDLPGASGRFTTPDDVQKRMVNLFTVENSITAGAGGGYSGEELITAEFDLTKANTDYALLGYLVDTECCSVRWRSADLGNLGVGGPGDELNRAHTARWFVALSERYGLPLIPVFSSANKNGTYLDVAQDENAAAVVVTSIFAELK